MKNLFLVMLIAVAFMACTQSEPSKCDKAQENFAKAELVYKSAVVTMETLCGFVAPEKARFTAAEACDKAKESVKVADALMQGAKQIIALACIDN